MSRISGYTLSANLSIAISTLMLGIMSGFFWTYSFNVNYGLLALDGDTYARVQSLLNLNVRHFMFFAFFFGTAIALSLALLLNYRHWRSVPFLLVLLALIIYVLGVVAYTRSVNLPLNYYTESWVIGNLPDDWEQVRSRWNQANLFRVLTSGSAFFLATLALSIRACR